MILLQSLLDNPVLSCCLAITIVSLSAVCGSVVLRYRAALNSSLLLSALLVILFCPVVVGFVLCIGVRFNISRIIPADSRNTVISIEPLSHPVDFASEFADVSDGVLLGNTQRRVESKSAPSVRPAGLSPNMRWHVLLGAWLIGSCIGTIRIFRALAGAKSIIARSIPIVDSKLETARQRAGQAIGLRHFPTVRTSEQIDGPVVVGIHAPVILLPPQFVNSLSTEQLKQVLLHEGTHVKHRDNCVRLIQQITTMTWWWHPLVHLLVSRLSLAREQVCDNTVLNEVDAVTYGETLLKIAVNVSNYKHPRLASALFGSKQSLEYRVQYFLDPRRSKMTHTRPFVFPVFLLLLFGAALTVNATRIQAQHPVMPSKADDTSSNLILDGKPTDSSAPARPAAAKTLREVAIEVRGITCVSRFTDSLKEHFVHQIEGVEGCSYVYLPDSENETTKLISNPKSDGFMFGGKGRLTFQVQAEFNDRLLLKQLAESKYYDTSSWVWVRRSKLSDIETP